MISDNLTKFEKRYQDLNFFMFILFLDLFNATLSIFFTIFSNNFQIYILLPLYSTTLLLLVLYFFNYQQEMKYKTKLFFIYILLTLIIISELFHHQFLILNSLLLLNFIAISFLSINFGKKREMSYFIFLTVLILFLIYHDLYITELNLFKKFIDKNYGVLTILSIFFLINFIIKFISHLSFKISFKNEDKINLTYQKMQKKINHIKTDLKCILEKSIKYKQLFDYDIKNNYITLQSILRNSEKASENTLTKNEITAIHNQINIFYQKIYNNIEQYSITLNIKNKQLTIKFSENTVNITLTKVETKILKLLIEKLITDKIKDKRSITCGYIEKKIIIKRTLNVKKENNLTVHLSNIRSSLKQYKISPKIIEQNHNFIRLKPDIEAQIIKT